VSLSVHPDLIDEEEFSSAAPVSATEGDTAAPAQADEVATPAEATTEEPVRADAGPPEWLAQVREMSDPQEMLKLLAKNLPREQLSQNDVLNGIIGNLASKRVQSLLAEQEAHRAETAKLRALEEGDLYQLGQYSAQELQQRREQLAAQQQAQQQVDTSPFMLGIRAFQDSLPEAVRNEVAGKTFAPGGTVEEGFREYLKAVTEASVKHGFDGEIERRKPALRKALLADAARDEPVPELNGGPAASLREITDEQLGRMSLEESDLYLDERGQPRPGVKVRITRGINLQRR
jgi:hypothetical protein